MASFMEKNKCLSSAVVAKDGEIVAEVYKGSTRETKEQLFSSTKSVMSILFGLMEKEGLIKPDDRLGHIWNPSEHGNLWRKIKDHHYKKYIRIDSLLNHSSGLKPPTEKLDLLDILTIFADFGTIGGISIVDSLNPSKYVFPKSLGTNIDYIRPCLEVTQKNNDTHLYIDPTDNSKKCRQWDYYIAGNIFSYIIQKQTGMTPKEYASRKFFPGLGIENPKWLVNIDHIEYSGGGLMLTARQHLKIAQFMLQGARISPHHSQLLTSDWIRRATGKLIQIRENRWFGYQWYVGNGNRYQSSGAFGQIIGINETTKTIASIFSHETVKINNINVPCIQKDNGDILAVAKNLLALIDSANFEPEPLVDIFQENPGYCQQYSDPMKGDNCSEDYGDETRRTWMLKNCAKSCSERHFPRFNIDIEKS